VVLTQLGDRLNGDQIGERIGAGRKDQALALPTPQLTLGDLESPADIRPGIFLRWAWFNHGNILAGRDGLTVKFNFVSKST
jgi:hypothetical protein